jgi:hypothetical protein
VLWGDGIALIGSDFVQVERISLETQGLEAFLEWKHGQCGGRRTACVAFHKRPA